MIWTAATPVAALIAAAQAAATAGGGSRLREKSGGIAAAVQTYSSPAVRARDDRMPPITWTGGTTIQAAHINELRNAVK